MAKKKAVASTRSKNIHFSLNEKEYDLLCAYAKKYKIQNRSRWIRETLMNHVFKNLDLDYPTLFGENEMRR